jgi:hypothetical protein
MYFMRRIAGYAFSDHKKLNVNITRIYKIPKNDLNKHS